MGIDVNDLVGFAISRPMPFERGDPDTLIFQTLPPQGVRRQRVPLGLAPSAGGVVKLKRARKKALQQLARHRESEVAPRRWT
jgi:hypothetical protein